MNVSKINSGYQKTFKGQGEFKTAPVLSSVKETGIKIIGTIKEHKVETAAIVGTIVTAAVALGAFAYRGKRVDLSQIDFSKGIASLKNGKKYTGIASGVLPNGDKVKLQYKNGQLVTSAREGSVNFVKKFKNEDGKKIVTVVQDGAETKLDITDMQIKGLAKNAEIERQRQLQAINEQNALNRAKQTRVKQITLNGTEQERAFNAKTEQAQEYCENLFDKQDFSHKSAQEPAAVLQNDYKAKINAIALQRNAAEAKAEQAQEYYKNLFDKQNFSHKSAHESAESFLTSKTSRCKITPSLDDKGNIISQRIETKKGTVITEYFDKDGNITLRTAKHADRPFLTTTTLPGEDSKIVYSRGDFDDNYVTQKLYAKDEKGKLKCIHRESYDTAVGTKKVVDQFANGNSKTVVTDYYNVETVTIRDKKGNIISQYKTDGKYGGFDDFGDDVPPPPPTQEITVLAEWYKDYLNLCKKYGVSPRMCGITGGAGDHYYELCLRRRSPEEYASYLRLQEYRAQYDEKARLMNYLREEGPLNEIFNPESEAVVSKLAHLLSAKQLSELSELMECHGFTLADVDEKLIQNLEGLDKLMQAMGFKLSSIDEKMFENVELKDFSLQGILRAINDSIEEAAYGYKKSSVAFSEVSSNSIEEVAYGYREGDIVFSETPLDFYSYAEPEVQHVYA